MSKLTTIYEEPVCNITEFGIQINLNTCDIITGRSLSKSKTNNIIREELYILNFLKLYNKQIEMSRLNKKKYSI